MRKANAAEAQGQKPESRFAILTSGLLARKGAAAPSNAPVADPAEETTAFAIDPQPQPNPPPQSQVKPPPASHPAPQPAQKPAPSPAAKAAPGKPPARSARPATLQAPILPAMTVINERSIEAGYPDNPTPEEIEAFEAEITAAADSIAAPDAPEPDKPDDDDFDVDDAPFDAAPEPPAASPFDPEDEPPRVPPPVQGRSIEMPAARVAGLGERRAAVTFRMTTRDFLRLKLGAAEMNMTAQDVILEALEEFLDARGVESLRGCVCLEKSAALLCATPCADAAERE